MRIISAILLFITLLGCKEDKKYLAVSKIKSAAKLATTETVINKVILANQERRFLGIVRLGNAHFAARTKAIVKAGIDLNELEKDDVIIEDKRIELKLPAVKVLSFDYPFSEYEIDFEVTRDGFLNRITIEDHERLYRMAELDIRRKLELTGLKEVTEQKTRSLIEGILRGIGYEEIYISFKPGKFIEAPRLDQEDIL